MRLLAAEPPRNANATKKPGAHAKRDGPTATRPRASSATCWATRCSRAASISRVQAAPFKNTAKEASVALAIEIDGNRLPFNPPNEKGLVAEQNRDLVLRPDRSGQGRGRHTFGAGSHAPPRDARARHRERRAHQPADESSTGPLSAAHRCARRARRADGHGVLRPRRARLPQGEGDDGRVAAGGRVNAADAEHPARSGCREAAARRRDEPRGSSRGATSSRCTRRSTTTSRLARHGAST